MKTYEVLERRRQANAGGRTVWEIPHPAEATIRKLVVVQTGGATAEAFTATLYNSKKVLGASQSSGGADPDGDYAGDPAVYQVMPTQDGVAGRLTAFFESGYAFANQDGGSTNKEKKVYVEIEIPGGSGDATWDVAIGGTNDVG